MHKEYAGVTTRFLHQEERLLQSDEKEMPLVIEAKEASDVTFLQTFLADYSTQLLGDVARYGAILFRGFAIHTDEAFEQAMLSIKGFKGISEAFMSEQGRVPVDNLQYVLHTNAIYKTGGTLYLGGFHTENYYVPDVPSYICFCCRQPSDFGGETGIVNTQKVYQALAAPLKEKLEKSTYLTAKWLVTDVAKRYQIPIESVEAICREAGLTIVGEGNQRLILMYKPSVFEHPETQKTALQINLFAIPYVNGALRKVFMQDYPGKRWFWHRLIWRIPTAVLKVMESAYLTFASLFQSPRESFDLLLSKWNIYRATKKIQRHTPFNQTTVSSCFDANDVTALAKLIRRYYSSCLWKKGDILLVDNRQVMHAGMPGAGPRVVRAMIGNPVEISYAFDLVGKVICRERVTETIGYYMANAGAAAGEMTANAKS